MKQIAKLAIVGSRTFNDYALLERFILDTFDYSTLREIISGGAIGTDTLAAQFAHTFNLPLTIFLPQWHRHGRAAGNIRNRAIVDAAEFVLAVSIQNSPGTRSTINYCQKVHKPYLLLTLSADGHTLTVVP